MLHKLLLLAISSTVAFVGGDLLLRLLTPFPIHTELANRRHDDVLLYVAEGSLDDIDSRGFRNPAFTDSPELVAIGDSHTFGLNATSEESWPYQAAATLQASVYNYGMPGYGSLQYLHLFEEALGRNPRHVVIGSFLANDVLDYCKLSANAFWREQLSAADLTVARCPENFMASRPMLRSLARVAASSAILSAVDVLVVQGARMRSIADDPQQAIVVRHGEHSTVLPRQYLRSRETMTDLARPEVREGWEVLRWSFEQMIRKADGRVRISVLIIPSKENVLYESVAVSHPLHAELERIVMRERALARELESFLAERGVETASPLICLQHALDTGKVYPSNDDGHPLVFGYACYARAVVDLVRRAAPAA